ncbi:MAG: serine/threonine protein kinase [Sandaracinaceae bacterium]
MSDSDFPIDPTFVDFDVPMGDPLPARPSTLSQRPKKHIDDPLLGQTVGGRFLVTQVLADGGMGRVYIAEDPERGPVALKTLLPDFSEDHDLVRRFRRELTALQQAQCPYVVELIASGELDDQRAYFVMEFVEGVSLAEVMSAHPRGLDVLRALRITLQLCAALTPAHRLGIIHRDLKPENVMLTRIGEQRDLVKVLDFGLAKPKDAGLGLTSPGMVLGTPDYMSPEQCQSGKLDHRSDIYALGVLTYEMVCGETPFPYPELIAVVRAHILEAPVPPSRRDPKVVIPKPFEWMLLCCLHKDPERRFQSMDEVQEEMGHIASALGVHLPVPGEPEP